MESVVGRRKAGFTTSHSLDLAEVLLQLPQVVVRQEALLCGGSPQGVKGARAFVIGLNGPLYVMLSV